MFVHPVDDHPDGEAEEPVDRPHPFRVPLRQIVVHGDEMHAPPRQGVQDDREGGDERLPLAGPHLGGDLPLVQHHPAHELDVEVPHGEDALAGLSDGGENLGEKVVKGFPHRKPLTELRRARGETVVREIRHRRLERVDPLHHLTDPFQDPLVVRAEHFLEEISQHRRGPLFSAVVSKKKRPDGVAPREHLAKAPFPF